MYIAGVNNDTKKAVYLIILVNDTLILFPKLSSVVRKKSLNVAGNIKIKGEVSTIIAIFPFNRFWQTLSGLSVDIIVGNTDLFSFSIKFLIVPADIIPSISMLFNNFLIFSTFSFFTMLFIYIIDTLVLVYFPISCDSIQRLLSLILLLINPIFVWVSSTNASIGPLMVLSAWGVDIDLDKFLLVSNAIKSLQFSINMIVKP